MTVISHKPFYFNTVQIILIQFFVLGNLMLTNIDHSQQTHTSKNKANRFLIQTDKPSRCINR